MSNGHVECIPLLMKHLQSGFKYFISHIVNLYLKSCASSLRLLAHRCVSWHIPATCRSVE